MGVALKNWQRIEHGQNMTLHTLARVSAVVGCEPEELVGRAGLEAGALQQKRPAGPRRAKKAAK